ncbi:hypothetical protein HDU93_006974 [Gonapodya sp. JEL0774]|nr:hypothetical protein HDU93_006974 [Gonapodya sp. JEL0774]
MCRKKGECRRIFLDLRTILLNCLDADGEGESEDIATDSLGATHSENCSELGTTGTSSSLEETQPNDLLAGPRARSSHHPSRRSGLRRLLSSLPVTSAPTGAAADEDEGHHQEHDAVGNCLVCPTLTADVNELRSHTSSLELRLMVLQTSFDSRLDEARAVWNTERETERRVWGEKFKALEAKAHAAEERATLEAERLRKERKLLQDERRTWDEEGKKLRDEAEMRKRKVAKMEFEESKHLRMPVDLLNFEDLRSNQQEDLRAWKRTKENPFESVAKRSSEEMVVYLDNDVEENNGDDSVPCT